MDEQVVRFEIPQADAVRFLRDARDDAAAFTLTADEGTKVTARLADVLSDGTTIVALENGAEVEPLADAPEIAVEYLHRGIQHHFLSRVAAGRADALRLAPPRSFARIQRRRYFRVAAADGSEATFTTAYGARRTRRLLNVSAGGVGMALALEGDDDIQSGQELPDVQVLLPGDDVYLVGGTVRFVEPRAGARGPHRMCGVEFTHIDVRDRQRMMQYVTRRERELLGRRDSLRAPAAQGSVLVLPRAGGRLRVRTVINFSSGGAAVQLVADADRDLVRGLAIPKSELHLPDLEPISATVSIVWVRGAGHEMTCGVQLSGLTPEARERINQRARLGTFGGLRSPADG